MKISRSSRIKKTTALLSAIIMMATLNGCGAKTPPIYPIEQLPSELTENFASELDVAPSQDKDNGVHSDADIDPNAILREHEFKVYYDNTIGCFMGYTDLYKNDKNGAAYETFRQSMVSYRYTLDVSKSYKTYTLRPDGSGLLAWQDYSRNVFDNFSDVNMYTQYTGGQFGDHQSPITLWADLVKSELSGGSKSTYVYISDLNEQSGLLTTTAKQIRDILAQYPDKDLLVMPYVLSFKGKISVITADNEGDLSTTTTEKVFDKEVDRNYYALAVGDRDVISAFYKSVSQEFAKVDLSADKFLYRDHCYSEVSTEATAKDGTKIDKDALTKTPAQFEVLSPHTTKKPEQGKEAEESIFPISSLNTYLKDTPTGSVYAFESSIVKMDDNAGDVSVKLTSDGMYYLDTENTAVYVYNNSMADKLADHTDERLWIEPENNAAPADNISVSSSGDTVTVSLSKYLSPDPGRVPAVIVSVPVKIPYTQTTAKKTITEIGGLKEFVDKYTAPIKSGGDKNAKFTKTRGFDEFIKTLVDYDSIANAGLERKEVVEESDDSSTVSGEAIATRLNILVFADSSNT